MSKISVKEFKQLLKDNLSMELGSTGYESRYTSISDLINSLQKTYIDLSRLSTNAKQIFGRKVVDCNVNRITFDDGTQIIINANDIFTNYTYYITANNFNQKFLIQQNCMYDDFEDKYFNFYNIFLIFS